MIPDDIDVKAIRERQGLSQSEFAKAYGFKLTAVKSRERTNTIEPINRLFRPAGADQGSHGSPGQAR